MIQTGYKKSLNNLRILILMAMFGALMFVSYKIMEFLPNIHMLALIISVLTIVYRKWALLAVIVYVFLSGLFGGFAIWWIPYLYIWPLLWCVLMIIPQRSELKFKVFISAIICTVHGFTFGILYAPVQALFFKLSFEQTLAWIASGFYFDILHGVGNVIMSALIYPLSKLLFLLEKRSLSK